MPNVATRVFASLILLYTLCATALPTSAQDLKVSDFQKTFSTTTPPTRTRINETLPLIAILMEFPDQRNSTARFRIHDMLFGADTSVVDYFDWVSDGKFQFTMLGPGTLGWFTAPHPQAEYLADNQNGTNRRRADSILVARDALAQLDLAAIDRNGDKILTEHELTIVLIWASDTERSAAIRRTEPRRIDLGNGFSIDMPLLAIYEDRIGKFSGGELSPGVAAHEIGHIAFGLGDQYEGAPGDTMVENLCGFSLMARDTALDSRDGVPILDAWGLLQLGWTKPRLVTQTQCVTLKSVEHGHEQIIIPIWGAGTSEYFIVENRFPEGSYNGGFKAGAQGIDQGLAIWHIDESIQNGTIINHRRAMRLMRAFGPVPAVQCFDNQQPLSLFDSTDPVTGYALTSNSAPRSTRKRNGIPTGIEISSIPSAGDTVQFFIRTPYQEIADLLDQIDTDFDLFTARIAELELRTRLLEGQVRAGDITQQQFDVLAARNATEIADHRAKLADLAAARQSAPTDTINRFAALPVANGCN